MKIYLSTNMSAYVPVAGIVILLILGSFSGAGMGMEMSVHCPLMGMDAICEMNPLEHIAAWQQMFASTLAKDASTALFLLVSLLAISLQRFRLLRVAPLPRHVANLRLRIPVIFNPLQEAFSSGILHPKIF